MQSRIMHSKIYKIPCANTNKMLNYYYEFLNKFRIIEFCLLSKRQRAKASFSVVQKAMANKLWQNPIILHDMIRNEAKKF